MNHRNRSILAVVFILLVPLLALSCATSQNLTAYDRAALGYIEASIAYEGLMSQLVAARSQHLVSDAAWSQIDTAQKTVNRVAPLLHTSLTLWRSTQTKPTDVDTNLAQLAGAVSTLTQAATQVTK